MRHNNVDVSTAKPEEGSLELTEELIRLRAYRFYEDRGCEDGYDLEDWLRAEAEITWQETRYCRSKGAEGVIRAA